MSYIHLRWEKNVRLGFKNGFVYWKELKRVFERELLPTLNSATTLRKIWVVSFCPSYTCVCFKGCMWLFLLKAHHVWNSKIQTSAFEISDKAPFLIMGPGGVLEVLTVTWPSANKWSYKRKIAYGNCLGYSFHSAHSRHQISRWQTWRKCENAFFFFKDYILKLGSKFKHFI